MPPELAASIRDTLLVTFQAEAEEHLATLSAAIEGMRNAHSWPDRDRLLEVTLRTMHTLKGASRSVGWADIERVGQLSETILRDLRAGEHLPPRAVEALGLACDAISGLLGGRLPPARFDAVEEELEILAAEIAFSGAISADAPTLPARSDRGKPQAAVPGPPAIPAAEPPGASVPPPVPPSRAAQGRFGSNSTGCSD